jgi:antitoxin (DNA-binding transcriptional repressor) of toxin-antitoxin stability system
MRTVNVADLKNRLSSYLQMVRNGEEVIVKDRDLPIARISPYPQAGISQDERRLVASGIMKLPIKGRINWEKFWAMPSPDLSEEAAVRAVLEEREEGR